jgi:hypothetical protein
MLATTSSKEITDWGIYYKREAERERKAIEEARKKRR